MGRILEDIRALRSQRARTSAPIIDGNIRINEATQPELLGRHMRQHGVRRSYDVRADVKATDPPLSKRYTHQLDELARHKERRSQAEIIAAKDHASEEIDAQLARQRRELMMVRSGLWRG